MKTYILYTAFQLVEEHLAQVVAEATKRQLIPFVPKGHKIEILSAKDWNAKKANLLSNPKKPHGIIFNSMALLDEARSIAQAYPDIHLVVYSGERIREPGIASVLKLAPNDKQQIAGHIWPT